MIYSSHLDTSRGIIKTEYCEDVSWDFQPKRRRLNFSDADAGGIYTSLCLD